VLLLHALFFMVVVCNIGGWLLRGEVLSSTSPAHNGEANKHFWIIPTSDKLPHIEHIF
jgi:hypothetical protein